MSKIAIVLTPGFADWEYALIGGTGGPFYGIDVRYFSPLHGKIQSQGGLTCEVADSVEAIDEWQPDATVVVGGLIWETKDAPDMTHVLTKQLHRGGTVAGICGGTLALARAGILNDVAHTSNDPSFLSGAKGYSGQSGYIESKRAVIDGQVITSPGIAPVTFTAAVFKSAKLEQTIVDQFQAMLASEHRMS